MLLLLCWSWLQYVIYPFIGSRSTGNCTSFVSHFLIITSRCSIIDLCLSVGSRREDDWTCPSCGNVNFSFRTTCNMRNCTQPRPADHNSVICGLLYYLYLEKQNHICFCYFLCRNSQSANILVCWCVWILELLLKYRVLQSQNPIIHVEFELLCPWPCGWLTIQWSQIYKGTDKDTQPVSLFF